MSGSGSSAASAHQPFAPQPQRCGRTDRQIIIKLGGVIVGRVGADGRHVIVRLDSGDLRLLLLGPADRPLSAVLPLRAPE